MSTNPFLPLFLTVFLGIFHLIGGGALGQGLRALVRRSGESRFFIIWGLGFGGLPLLFAPLLVSEGYGVYALIGPCIFFVSTFVSAYLDAEVDSGGVLPFALGSAALLLGLLSIPLVLENARGMELGLSDYLGGACFVTLFVGVGGMFAWTGLTTILRGLRTGDAEGRGLERDEPDKRKKG